MDKLLITQISDKEVKVLHSGFKIEKDYEVLRYNSFFDVVIEYTKEITRGCAVVVVAEEISENIKDMVKSAFIKNELDYDVTYVDYIEAFINYGIEFTSNIEYKNYLLLYQENSQLRTIKCNNEIAGYTTYISSEVLDTNESLAELSLQDRDNKLCEIIPKFIEDEIEVVYLTGEVFNGGYLNNSLSILCSNRRAFLDCDLFLLGGFATFTNSLNSENIDNYSINTPRMWKHNLFLRVKDRGEIVEQLLIGEKARYHDEPTSVDIINFDDEYLYFILDDKHFSIYVAELKTRLRKPCILNVEVKFIDKLLAITITENGFGKFLKPSNKKVVFILREDIRECEVEENINARICVPNVSRKKYYSKLIKKEISTIEELSFFIFENIHLVDEKFVDNDLIEFVYECIGQDIGSMGLSEAVVLILESNNLYSKDEIDIVRYILSNYKDGDFIMRAKMIGDKCLINKEYNLAIKHYDNIILKTHFINIDEKIYENVLFNKGVALARMLNFKDAYFIFKDLSEKVDDENIKLYCYLSLYFFDNKHYLEILDEIDTQIKEKIENIISYYSHDAILYNSGNRNIVIMNELIEDWKEQIGERS